MDDPRGEREGFAQRIGMPRHEPGDLGLVFGFEHRAGHVQQPTAGSEVVEGTERRYIEAYENRVLRQVQIVAKVIEVDIDALEGAQRIASDKARIALERWLATFERECGTLRVEYRSVKSNAAGANNVPVRVWVDNFNRSLAAAPALKPGVWIADAALRSGESVIALKSELASKLIERDPKRARRVSELLEGTIVLNGDAAGTNFAFGGPDNQYIYMEGAVSGTVWRFKAPYPGLIGPGGVRLPM